MLDTKKYQNMLEEGRRRASALEKKNAPLVKAADDARAISEGLQREVLALQRRLTDFEAGQVDMTDDDYLTARARVDLLRVKQKRAAETASAAVDALNAAQNTARGELGQLRGEALNAWRLDHRLADEEYRKEWGRL